MRHVGVATALAWLVIGGVDISPAAACSPVYCPSRGAVLPVDGATDVPTNTEIHVSYAVRCSYGSSGAYASPDDVQLRVVDTGELVALQPTTHGDRLRAVVELAPSTTYEILDRDWGGGGKLTCGEATAPIVVARFTTAAGPDVTPPSAPTALSTGTCRFDLCDSSACCGPYEATTTALTWDASIDDGPHPIAYVVSGEIVYGTSAGLYTFSSPYPAAFYPWGGVRTGSGARSIVAIDLAGNESPRSEAVAVDLDCRPIDGGAADEDGGAAPPDAARTSDAAARDAGTSDAEPSPGCTATRASASPWSLLVLGLALARAARIAASRRNRSGAE